MKYLDDSFWSNVKKSKEKPIFLVDMDGTCFDYDGAMIRDLNKLRHPSEPEINSDNLWELEKQPYLKARMDMIKSIPDWWFELEPIDTGFKIFEMGRQIGYDCQFLTKGPYIHSNAWGEKHRSIKKHFGDVDIHVVSNKRQTFGNILCDDYPPYLSDWLKKNENGFGIMPIRVMNKNFKHPRVVSHDSKIDHIFDILEKYYDYCVYGSDNKINSESEADQFLVRTYEYERGFGKRIMNIYYFKNLPSAEIFVDSYNKGNDLEIVPDTYYLAEKPEKML